MVLWEVLWVRYREPSLENIDDSESYVSKEAQYISDNTAFMHWSTELEQIHEVIDSNFLRSNRHRVGDLNKFLPLSNITNPKMIKLLRLRRMNMTMAKDSGLIGLADETMLDNLADCQTSRGVGGFYQNALITQKREFMDKTKAAEHKGLLRNLVKGKQVEDESNFATEE